jgi:DNA-directed RNA polymerase subunit RPC12/RpoP
VRTYIYDLIGKDLFRGYVNWDRGELVSAEAAQIKDGTCPNCGGRLELAGKGLVRCPYCGTEIYLSPAPKGAAAQAGPVAQSANAPPYSPGVQTVAPPDADAAGTGSADTTSVPPGA